MFDYPDSLDNLTIQANYCLKLNNRDHCTHKLNMEPIVVVTYSEASTVPEA